MLEKLEEGRKSMSEAKRKKVSKIREERIKSTQRRKKSELEFI